MALFIGLHFHFSPGRVLADLLTVYSSSSQYHNLRKTYMHLCRWYINYIIYIKYINYINYIKYIKYIKYKTTAERTGLRILVHRGRAGGRLQNTLWTKTEETLRR